MELSPATLLALVLEVQRVLNREGRTLPARPCNPGSRGPAGRRAYDKSGDILIQLLAKALIRPIRVVDPNQRDAAFDGFIEIARATNM